MTGPRDIIRQAANQRRQAERQPVQHVPAPAPMQPRAAVPADPQPARQSPQVSQWRTPPLMQTQNDGKRTPAAEKQEVGEDASAAGTRRPVPQNIGGHAIYRELMRSHDRMGTRHIGPRG